MKKVLFVCLGNICRSPMAEGAFLHLIKEKGLENRFIVDSAATSAFHIGDPPDARMSETAKKNGVQLVSIGRQAIPEDFDDFDIILAMDRSNQRNLEVLANENGKDTSKIRLMREFDPTPENMEVPDPYYGGQQGFDQVFDILMRSNQKLISYLLNE